MKIVLSGGSPLSSSPSSFFVWALIGELHELPSSAICKVFLNKVQIFSSSSFLCSEESAISLWWPPEATRLCSQAMLVPSTIRDGR